MSRQDEFDYLFKIVMIGDSGVGKTNLLSRFVDGTFNMDSKPTIGVEFATKTINVDQKLVKNQIWDTAGQERFRAITNAYYRGAVGAIIAFDLTKSRTFQNVQKWLAELKDNAEPGITIMLLGNKSDLENREIKQEVVSDYVISNKLLYLETSAASGSNVEEAFTQLIKEIYQKCKIIPEPTVSTTLPENQKTTKTNTTTVKNENQSQKNAKENAVKTQKKNETVKISAKKQGESKNQKKKGCC